MTALRDHDADHSAIRRVAEEWYIDSEERQDVLRDTLILHLGAFHGWTVTNRGSTLGLTPMLVSHNRSHQATDVLTVEHLLDPVIIQAIRQMEMEIQ